ncbi:MAG: hypothetical protein BGO54_02360 [Sphingobacteriales bacterium 46-32]|nr:MAG: hypothetical protein BGO54_02360 [Sphingobacteriales bacterium 46-32]
MLIPYTLEYSGIIIEVKRSSTDKIETIAALLDEALNQIVANRYAIELKTRGHGQYIGIAAVFHGKKLWLKYQRYSTLEPFELKGLE